MTVDDTTRVRGVSFIIGAALLIAGITVPAQQMVTETRDAAQTQDEDFAKAVKEWTTQPYFISPLVDHLPKVTGIPSPKDVLGYHVGAPAKLTYYADALKYYRALAAATPRVKVETIGTSDEDRELVVVWVSSDENIKNLQQNRDNLAKIADPRGLYRSADHAARCHDAAALSPDGRTPQRRDWAVRDADGTRVSPGDRNVAADQADSRERDRVGDAAGRSRRPRSQRRLVLSDAGAADGGRARRRCTRRRWWRSRRRRRTRWRCRVRTGASTCYHDNNRDINLSQKSMRAIADWYFTAHPPIMHDLHESLALLYTYSGAAPQNPNLDPILFTELPWFSNFELSQMTKWGMPGVYTHAFMDGWSPGYLGSVAYNHNGMMRMYETQSGREGGPGAAAGRGRRSRRRRRRCRCTRGSGTRRGARWKRAGRGTRRGPWRSPWKKPVEKEEERAAAMRRKVVGKWLQPVVVPWQDRRPDAAAVSRASGIAASRFLPARRTTSPAATTPTTCRPACSALCS